MTDLDIEFHEHEQRPVNELYKVAYSAVQERREMISAANERHQEILHAMSDDEIVALAAELGSHEKPSNGMGAVVAIDLIVGQPMLAMVIAERHFADCVSYHDKAVLVINDYLHSLWLGELIPSDKMFDAVLKAAASHRESHQRMIRAKTERSRDWPEGCC